MLEVENPQGLRQKRVSSWLGKEKTKQETKTLPQALLIQKTGMVWSVVYLLKTAKYKVLCRAFNFALVQEHTG